MKQWTEERKQAARERELARQAALKEQRNVTAAEPQTAVAEAPAEAPAQVTQSFDIASVLAGLQTQLEELKTSNERLRAEVAEARTYGGGVVQDSSNQRIVDEFGLEVNALPDGAIYLGSARAATIEQQVTAMRRQADRWGDPFDEERVRKVLVWMQLPIEQRRKFELEDIHPFICRHCGYGFEKHEEEDYRLHLSKHASKMRAITTLE